MLVDLNRALSMAAQKLDRQREEIESKRAALDNLRRSTLQGFDEEAGHDFPLPSRIDRNALDLANGPRDER